jgi:hypothetical protein
MASPNTLALREGGAWGPTEACVYAPGREPEVRGNHAPFHYFDGNREVRRHPERYPDVWRFKIKQHERGEL